MATSEKGTISCGYKKCKCPEEKLSNDTSRVEVKSYVPKNKSKCVIDWDDGGQASFHMDCWKEILKGSKKESTEFQTEEKEMIKEAKKTAEFFNSYDEIKKEGDRVAKMLLSAKHATVFTGAGISTSAGIGDFRGKGGKWTERDRSKKYGDQSKKKIVVPKRPKYADLRPTYTHEAIMKLVEMGIIKYVISQNVDGLHRLSGIPRDKISELHGNVFHEKCEKCDARYERPYAARSKSSDVPPKKCSDCKINHRTGRKCERKGCDNYLMNTVINFGDNLESDVLDMADEHCTAKDLILCLGSSLTVTPAADLVLYGEKPVKLVICNRQPTQYDDISQRVTADGTMIGSRVYGDCDHMMREVMRCILPEDELQEWEDGRDDRMKKYTKLRSD